MGSPHKAKWWFAWRPVRTLDTNRIVWLRKVYREWWFEKLYFEVAPPKTEPGEGKDV